MGKTALEHQLDQLHDRIQELRGSLDETQGQIEDFRGLVSRTATEAREVAEVLGRRGRGGGFPMGFFGILTVSLIGLALFSPNTLTQIYDRARNYLEPTIRNLSSVARERFGEMGQGPIA